MHLTHGVVCKNTDMHTHKSQIPIKKDEGTCQGSIDQRRRCISSGPCGRIALPKKTHKKTQITTGILRCTLGGKSLKNQHRFRLE